MKLSEFKNVLAQHKDKTIRFILPDGSNIPFHAHVTEVARIDKRFIDCGGTHRTESYCRLQTWVANDLEHRLSAGKLLGILNKSSSFMQTEDIEVDVEHEAPVISQFPVAAVAPEDGTLVVKLRTRHTACLAQDKCLPPQQPVYRSIPDFRKSAAQCCR